jgi:hypothetical protein
MQTQTKPQIVVADVNAVREFLLSGREIPRETRSARPHQKSVADVPCHQGIVRARTRPAAKD